MKSLIISKFHTLKMPIVACLGPSLLVFINCGFIKMYLWTSILKFKDFNENCTFKETETHGLSDPINTICN